jgi:hypothetical protein
MIRVVECVKLHTLNTSFVRIKAVAIPLARCARVPRASLARGSFAPRCIPQTRAFRRWIRPDVLRLLHFRPGGVSPSGHPTANSAAASTRRAFVPSMDLQTGEDFALPPDLHRPAVRRLDPRQGFRAHGPRTGRRAAPMPLPNPGRIGCALPTRSRGVTPCRFFAILAEPVRRDRLASFGNPDWSAAGHF